MTDRAPIPEDLQAMHTQCVEDKCDKDFDNSVVANLIERIASLKQFLRETIKRDASERTEALRCMQAQRARIDALEGIVRDVVKWWENDAPNCAEFPISAIYNVALDLSPEHDSTKEGL